jgi:hypothetical protein
MLIMLPIRILDPLLFYPWIQDPYPRSGMGKKIRILVPESGSYFQELSNNFWVKNTEILYCVSGSGIRCFLNSEFGKEKIGSGSVTLHVNYTASSNRIHDFGSILLNHGRYPFKSSRRA